MTNTTTPPRILSTEPSTTLFVQSGDGVFTVFASKHNLFVLRQVANGKTLHASATIVAGHVSTEVDLREWDDSRQPEVVGELLRCLETVAQAAPDSALTVQLLSKHTEKVLKRVMTR